MRKIITSETASEKVEKTVKQSNKNKINARHDVSVAWTTAEPSPHKFWWYIGLCAIAIWIMLFLFLIREWLLLICIFTASLAIIITYLKAPAKSDCQLNHDTVTINKQTLKLNDYYAYTIATTRISKTAVQTVILLLPKHHLRFACQINLPADPNKKEEVLSAFNQVLPLDNAKGFLLHCQILDYITSLLRLNF